MEITNINLAEGFIFFIELMFFVITAIYLIFAFIITRQVNLMNKSMSTPTAPLFVVVSFIHFIAALVITIFALLNLL